MRAPAFWSNPPDQPGLIARALSPLGSLYALGTARRVATGARAPQDKPVICVGNINAGGVGKTPTVIAVVQALQGLFHSPHVVSRGYGGTAVGPVQVDAMRHTADKVGDEPLLIGAFADTWVSKDRLAGVQAAIANGATAVVLDDGFQHAAVQYDVAIVVVDAELGFGNGRCIPAGPLREPYPVALKRADILVTIGPDAAQDAFDNRYPDAADLPRVRGTLEPLQTGMDWAGLRTLAFAGIGRPEKFFGTLRALGADVVRAEPLGDHASLSPTLLRRLEADAAALNAQLITTEKDAARLPPSFRSKVITLPVRLTLQDPEPLTTLLKSRAPAE